MDEAIIKKYDVLTAWSEEEKAYVAWSLDLKTAAKGKTEEGAIERLVEVFNDYLDTTMPETFKKKGVTVQAQVNLAPEPGS